MSQWLVLASLIGGLAGLASAIFLVALDWVTSARLEHAWLVWLLPVAGLGLGAMLEGAGKSVVAGTNVVIDTIHDGGPRVPARLAPLVLLGTLTTHLFGGSAGREGTAVQMGASLADLLCDRLKLSGSLRSELLAAGVAGGFGSVFGTPLAGALFGMEFLTVGRLHWRSMLPCVIASLVGDRVTRALGVVHTDYPRLPSLELSSGLLLRWLVLAIAVALTVVVFIELTHWLKRRDLRLRWRMALGGAAVVALSLLAGQRSLGLGVETIVAAFHLPAEPSVFAWKLLFTSLTVGSGFPGGEVTPLFFIGATLGSALSSALGLPVGMAAGVGLASAFGAASKSPLALSLMAAELFGLAVLPHVLVVSVVATLVIGRRSLYTAQRFPVGRGRMPLSTKSSAR